MDLILGLLLAAIFIGACFLAVLALLVAIGGGGGGRCCTECVGGRGGRDGGLISK